MDDPILDAALIGALENEIWGAEEPAQRRHRVQNPVRVGAYAENIVPLYNDQEFKSHFRMHRPTFMVRSDTSCTLV